MYFSKIKESLHDAILQSIKLDWESGRTIVKFNLSEVNSIGGQKLNVFCVNASKIQIPRSFEWGRSNSVNDVIMDGKNTLKIEMQSGDTIVLEGESYSYEMCKNLIVIDNE